METVRHGKDPLELARRQLDFAAIATQAPSSKEILFKAQTMVPMAPVRPWQRLAKTVGIAVAAGLLIFMPWLPQRASFSLVRITFEQTFNQYDAQDLVSHYTREMPVNVLTGVDYSGGASGKTGHLTLRASSAYHTSVDLRRTVEAALSSAGYELPYQILDGQINRTTWKSPAEQVVDFVAARTDGRRLSNSDLARSIMRRESVYAEGLRAQLRQLGYQLEDFGFTGRDAGERAGYDFTIACWPEDIGLSVRHYQNLTDSEQTEIRERTREYLTTLNINRDASNLVDAATNWLPIVVYVYDTSGRYDPQLTARMQAWIEQPDANELASVTFEPLDSVRDALKHVIPDYQCRLDYLSADNPYAGAGRFYKIKVTQTNLKAGNRALTDLSQFSDEDELSY
ncbi:hypothetical protein JW859_08965 [bacterium]|nr:hypothetical protein [bacterium]